MNQHSFKRVLALLLACLMTLGCFAYATEEIEAAAQELLLGEEQAPNGDAADEEAIVGENPQQGQQGDDASPDAAFAEKEGETAAEDETVVEDMAVASNNSCVHAHTDSYQYMQDAVYTAVDDKYHESFGYLVTVVFCDDCGETISRVVDTEKTTELERHDFSSEDSSCYQCGAVNNCTHKTTSSYDYWRDAEYRPIDGITHEVSGQRVMCVWCEDCETTLSEEVVPGISSEIQRHWFEDGVCDSCGYVNTCPHAHTCVEKYCSEEGEYTQVDGQRHQWRGYQIIEQRCLDCEEVLSSELGEEPVSLLWDHEFENGVCYLCGYVNTCAHKYTYVETDFYNGKATLTPVDDACHEYSGYPEYYEVCVECGEQLKRWSAEKPITRLEDHYFENGLCNGCGYRISCEHKRVDRWTSFEGSTYEDVGNDRYHISHGTLYKYEICLDCDKDLSRETSDFTNKESHNYVNGKCENCGHVKACDHSRTVEYEWETSYEYKDVSATSHTCKVILEKHRECTICGEYLGKTGDVKVTVKTEKHYFYGEEVCACGRRNTCKHNGKINERVYWQNDTVYTPVDGTYHMAEGTQIKDYTCDQCGRLMKSEDLGHVKKKVEHNFSEYRSYCWSCYADGVAEPPKSVSIAQQNQKLSIGETLQLTAEISPAGASTSLSWTSSDVRIATVDANGLVTPVKEGSVTITVKTANGKSGATKITVVDPYVLTGVKLDKTGTVNLNLGETLTLIPSPVPETAQATYTWKTSSTKVAKVENGVVTPIGEGTATIIVTAKRGSITKTASVKVKVVDPYKPTSVKLDRTGTVNLNLGESLTLTPSLSPETAQATYSWKTSSTKIATVADGVVTPVGEGTATITVTAKRGSITKTASVKVKVVDPYKPTSVKLDKTGTLNLNLGESLTLTPSLSPETAQATYSWKTSSTKIATVVDGVVTPVGEGTATITVTAKRGSIAKTATVKVKVVDPYKPTVVKLDKTGTVNLNLGESLTLTPSLSPETAQATYSWKTSSTKIATVADGVVTPVGEGTATITVTATRGKIKKTATVKVKVFDPYKPTSVKLDKTGTVSLNLGESLTLTPSLSPETAQATYSWKTSSTKIATVADGMVTPVGEGTATIIVTATRGKIKKTATVKVKVVDPYKPTSLKLKETGTVWLELGDSTQLTPILGPETAKATYSWKTSSTKIATVDENGVVRPVAKGTATITVTATRGKIKKTASVKVKVVEPYVVDALVLSHRDAPKDLKVKVGELCDVTVSVKPASAQATANLSFTASNGNVSVTKQASNKFRVTGVKAGTTTITVKDVNTGLKTTMKVVVTK